MNEERPIPGHTTVKLENTGEQREESKHFQTRGTKDREWKWHRLSQQPLWKLKFYTRADCQSRVKIFSVMWVAKILLPLLTFLGSYWKICTTKSKSRSRKKTQNPQACGECCSALTGTEWTEGRDRGRTKPWSGHKEKAESGGQESPPGPQLFPRPGFRAVALWDTRHPRNKFIFLLKQFTLDFSHLQPECSAWYICSSKS